MKNKKILLICPSFFGYEKKIRDQIERNGNIVDYVDERPSNGFFYKLALRLGLGCLFRNYNYNYYLNCLNELKDDYDIIFYINIETIDEKIINLIRLKYNGGSHVLYMWDSLSNKPNYIKLSDKFTKIYSFDEVDCEKNENLTYYPLFSCMKKTDINKKEYGFSFVGTAHGDRVKIIKEIEFLSIEENINTFFYLYYPSRMLWLIRCVFGRGLTLRNYHDVNFVPLDYAKVKEIINKSYYVVDISHAEQSGITMRSFEVLCSGTKLFTTNSLLLKSQFFFDDMVKPLDFQNIKIPSIYDQKETPNYSHYYLESWLKKILS